MRVVVLLVVMVLLAGCSPESDATATTTTTVGEATSVMTPATPPMTTSTTTAVITTAFDPSKYVIHNVESLVTTSTPGLFTTVQDMTAWGNGYGWGGLAQLFVGGQIGDWIAFEVPITDAGRYDIELWLTRAPDFGLIRVTIDGVDIDDIDLYHTEVMPTQGLSMGEVDLAPGLHTVSLTVLGKSPQSTGTSFGIDTITVIGPK